jgi:serine/threonine protein phosphatase 1
MPMRPNAQTTRSRLPEGWRIYAIGDVHGRADLLERVLTGIDAQLDTDPAVRSVELFLGDYVDRGPASREVLDRLIKRSQERETVCLRGNHETYIAAFLNDPTILSEWRHYGGLQTLMSYGLTPTANADWVDQERLAADFDEALPENHRHFLNDLKLSFTCGDYFFAHAGVRPGIPLANQREEDLLWIRQDFLMCEDDFGKTVVHGHTPVHEPEIRPNRINIDTGAYATGQLTCLVLEDDKISFL